MFIRLDRFSSSSNTYSLTDQYYHSLSVDASTTVSNESLNIGEQVTWSFSRHNAIGYHSNGMTYKIYP